MLYEKQWTIRNWGTRNIYSLALQGFDDIAQKAGIKSYYSSKMGCNGKYDWTGKYQAYKENKKEYKKNKMKVGPNFLPYHAWNFSVLKSIT